VVAIDNNRRTLGDSIVSERALDLGYQKGIVSALSRGLIMVMRLKVVVMELDSTDLPSSARTLPARIWVPANMPATAATKKSLPYCAPERRLTIYT
jgi:hypothetical protein